MIKSWEELGEVLADFESRLTYLENCLPGRPEEDRAAAVIVNPLPQPSFKHLQAQIDQNRTHLLHLQNKLVEHIDAPKKRRGKY